MINIAIRATYYIFCCRNRKWNSPDLMQFCFLFFLSFFFFFWCCFVLFLFLFVFCFFNNSISSSICKLSIRSEIYNCTFKNTNKVSIISSSIIIIIIIIVIIITFHNSLFLLTCTYEPLSTNRCLSTDTMSRIITALKEL